MKNFNDVEFFLFNELQRLKQKYPDLTELSDLEARAREMINENSICLVQQALTYSLIGEEGAITEKTKAKLERLFENGLAFLRQSKTDEI